MFTLAEAHSLIGRKVRALTDLAEVPAGTRGFVESAVWVVQEWYVKVIWQPQPGTEYAEWFNKEEFNRGCRVE